MAVNPINAQVPGTAVGQGDSAAAVRQARHHGWAETLPAAGGLSRKDRNAMILAALANPGSLALPGVGDPASSALAALTNAGSLAVANLGNDPAATQALAGAGAATPGLLAALADSGTLALAGLAAPASAAPAVPDGSSVLASAATLNAINLAAQDAVAAAQDAVAATAKAADAVTAAADAVSAVLAGASAAPRVPALADPSALATDATAKYLGAGFLGLPAAPGILATAQPEGVPAVDGVQATPALAGNTYSNPQDRAFGQSAAHLAQTAPMVEVPELDLEG